MVVTGPDYCIVAFAIIVIISVFHWIIHGRKHFTGPRIMSSTVHRDNTNHTHTCH